VPRTGRYCNVWGAGLSPTMAATIMHNKSKRSTHLYIPTRNNNIVPPRCLASFFGRPPQRYFHLIRCEFALIIAENFRRAALTTPWQCLDIYRVLFELIGSPQIRLAGQTFALKRFTQITTSLPHLTGRSLREGLTKLYVYTSPPSMNHYHCWRNVFSTTTRVL